jgi:hypothetical protein
VLHGDTAIVKAGVGAFGSPGTTCAGFARISPRKGGIP